ncbi:hypothetical protein GGX14DRAFT_629113 [Mycena pura]|uniref:Uncharacterized protein n=1 Tax=Mycena pura TaxID=153505 RepID=A0AAD7E423_9AGAR|nr:hypothetical protein GGX14DRAFT_629113 [Mycena pura]
MCFKLKHSDPPSALQQLNWHNGASRTRTSSRSVERGEPVVHRHVRAAGLHARPSVFQAYMQGACSERRHTVECPATTLTLSFSTTTPSATSDPALVVALREREPPPGRCAVGYLSLSPSSPLFAAFFSLCAFWCLHGGRSCTKRSTTYARINHRCVRAADVCGSIRSDATAGGSSSSGALSSSPPGMRSEKCGVLGAEQLGSQTPHAARSQRHHGVGRLNDLQRAQACCCALGTSFATSLWTCALWASSRTSSSRGYMPFDRETAKAEMDEIIAGDYPLRISSYTCALWAGGELERVIITATWACYESDKSVTFVEDGWRYCILYEPTDTPEAGSTGGSGASFISNPSSGGSGGSGSAGSTGNDKGSTGGGGGKEKGDGDDDDEENGRDGGEAMDDDEPRNPYHRNIELIPTNYSSPKLHDGNERIVKQAAIAFSQAWSPPYPSFTISPTTEPKSLLFHATRASCLPSFGFDGIKIQTRPNELHAFGAFYTSNSLAHAVMHCLTYHHSPNPEQVDPVAVIVFAVEPKHILGNIEGFKAHVLEVPANDSLWFRDKYRDFSVFVNKNWASDPIARREQSKSKMDFIVAPICVSPSIERNVGLVPAPELGGSRPLQVAAATRKAAMYLDGCVVNVRVISNPQHAV